MKKHMMIIGAFIATFIVFAGINSGFQSVGNNPIKGALADIIITRKCQRCNGTGVVYIKKKCYTCPDGVEKIPQTCPECNGTGKVTERKSTH